VTCSEPNSASRATAGPRAQAFDLAAEVKRLPLLEPQVNLREPGVFRAGSEPVSLNGSIRPASSFLGSPTRRSTGKARIHSAGNGSSSASSSSFSAGSSPSHVA
jgi:hypothetical protein